MEEIYIDALLCKVIFMVENFRHILGKIGILAFVIATSSSFSAVSELICFTAISTATM